MGSVYNKLGGERVIEHDLIPKNITANGDYYAINDDADGYSSVNVNVQPTLATKSITQNGTYNASSDSAQGYSQVTVNVQPTRKEKTITANGTYNASNDNAYGYSKVTVNVKSSRVSLWSGRATQTFNVNLSSYKWVLVTVTDDGSTTTNLLLQVGGDWSWAGGYWSSLTQEHKVTQQLKATTTQIVFGSGDNMAVTAVYGITNMD